MENSGYLLMNVAKKLRYQLNQELHRQNLTAAQWAVLQQVTRFEHVHTPCRVVDLVATLGMDKPTAADIVQRLIGMNLLERTRSALDKRAFDLTLTDAGNTAVVQAATTSDHVLAQFSAALTPTEQEQFSKLLQKLNEVNY